MDHMRLAHAVSTTVKAANLGEVVPTVDGFPGDVA